MTQIYLDNAATTHLHPAVLEAMLPYMSTLCGNPSSVHAHGRKAKVAVEKARKQVAELLHVSPAEIFFTSGGTEGNNTALLGTIAAARKQDVITSSLEHHAVLHSLIHLSNEKRIRMHRVDTDRQGRLKYDHLEQLLQTYPYALVSLMHGNNELGNLNDLERIGSLCKTHNAFFHTDAVQTIGHFALNLQALPVDMAVGSAHKFHGPKGVGLLYVSSEIPITPLIHGGAQERNMRGGTENVPGIVGLSKALEIAHENLAEDRAYIQGLKDRMIERLQALIPDVAFNGMSADANASLYTILNVSLPPSDSYDMLVFNLDIQQISASVGSACASGSQEVSHVLQSLGLDDRRGNVRLSFSKYNTSEEIDYVAEQLALLCKGK